MSEKAGFFIIVGWVMVILQSCSVKNSFPEKKSERFTRESVVVTGNVTGSGKIADTIISEGINNLVKYVADFDEHKSSFDLCSMEKEWDSVQKKSGVSGSEMPEWIKSTGLLLELTSDAKYADELQNIANGFQLPGDSVSAGFCIDLVPFIFTRNVDHINVNLVANASAEYQHSLGGRVKITQEVVSPSKILIRFSMEEKRYVELNILIPADSRNSSVIEKNVKYVAHPGEYCLVARKWKEGDFVEVNL